MKYFVSEKASFVCDGRVYKPGDEIDEKHFEKPALEAAIKNGKLLTPEQFKAASEKKDKPSAPPAPNGPVKKNVAEMTIEELQAYAAEKKIDLKGVNDKPGIIAVIKEAEAKGNK